MRTGMCGVFLGYGHQPKGAEPVFERGDLCVVTYPDAEGAFRCAAISVSGEVASWRTDLLFAEEICWLHQAPLIVGAGRGV